MTSTKCEAVCVCVQRPRPLPVFYFPLHVLTPPACSVSGLQPFDSGCEALHLCMYSALCPKAVCSVFQCCTYMYRPDIYSFPLHLVADEMAVGAMEEHLGVLKQRRN